MTPKALLSKAKRLAKQRETQFWILLSPREAKALLAGTVPASVRRMVQRLLTSKGLT